jgi:rhodanese-related sulfurtransferase
MNDSVSASELLAMIDSAEPPVIIDVRSPEEFKAGHVPGARNYPFWTIGVRASEFSELREEPIVLYCGFGPRATASALALRMRGFRGVRCLGGHWNGWVAAAHPTETGLVNEPIAE